MFVISTRNFPPEIGVVKNLMGGLAISILKHGTVKIFADKNIVENDLHKNEGINITRVLGIKIFRK